MIVHLAKLAAIACVATLGLSIPAAHAAPNARPSPEAACKAKGGLWVPNQGCADKTCSSGGRTYTAGETRGVKSIKGNTNFFMCDGFTGQWEKV
ncbi:MAG: hypothetical protein K2Q06_00805 [Parvularculaceae bacterium]|nr:hypothetical protein [Parvularculaceae bacterium]